MGYLAVKKEKRIYFEHYPAGELTVVLSHGWGMGLRVWDDTVAFLQDNGIGVLTYDHRCCGNSDKDFGDVSIAALGDDIAALCSHLGLSRVVLNGWSLGGAVVVDATAKLGGSVAGVVLTCAASPRYTQCSDFAHGGQPEDVAATVAALRADRINFLKGLYFEGAFARPVSDDVKHRCWQIALQASPGADASLGALASIDQRALMQGIAAPALVFIGGQDAVLDPQIARVAADTFPSATAVEMADCGHAPFLEDSDTYNAKLLEFLKGI